MAYLKDVIQEIAKEALIELFKSYNVTLTFTDLQPVKQDDIKGFLGMIGFSGEIVKGNISIWSDANLLTKTGPIDVNKTDWVAEIANQFIGRVKNKLLHYNVEILLGTPTSIETSNLILNFIHTSVFKLRFTTGAKEEVFAFVDAVFDKSTEVELSNDDTVDEGDMLIF